MATKLGDDPITENAKKILAEERKVSDRSRAEYTERMKGKPTPTQEENDLAMLGARILEHEDDGSGPDPHNRPQHAVETRQLEGSAARPQTYKTKTAES